MPYTVYKPQYEAFDHKKYDTFEEASKAKEIYDIKIKYDTVFKCESCSQFYYPATEMELIQKNHWDNVDDKYYSKNYVLCPCGEEHTFKGEIPLSFFLSKESIDY